jgi:hypothetical protein
MSISAATYAILSLVAVKEYLNIEDGDDAQDDFLQRWINSISSAIESFIGGPVKAQTFTEVYDGDGDYALQLRKRPIISLATPAATDLQYRIDLKSPWQTLVADMDYVVVRPDAPFSIVLCDNVFPAGFQNIRIAYKAGYSSIPGDIERVLVEAVSEIHKESNRGSGRLGQGSKGMGASGTNDSTSFFRLTKEHKATLSRYRWRSP